MDKRDVVFRSILNFILTKNVVARMETHAVGFTTNDVGKEENDGRPSEDGLMAVVDNEIVFPIRVSTKGLTVINNV